MITEFQIKILAEKFFKHKIISDEENITRLFIEFNSFINDQRHSNPYELLEEVSKVFNASDDWQEDLLSRINITLKNNG